MTANQIDTALAARVPDFGRLLLEAKEDQWFDRKSRKIMTKDLAPALVAFANAEGGTIVIGIHGGRVEGMRRFPDKENDLRQAPIDFTSPPVRTEFSRVACFNDDGERDYLLVVRIDPSEGVHETATVTAISASAMSHESSTLPSGVSWIMTRARVSLMEWRCLLKLQI